MSAAQLRAYWRTKRGALPYRHDVLAKHAPSLLVWIEERLECGAEQPELSLGCWLTSLSFITPADVLQAAKTEIRTSKLRARRTA